MQLQFCRTIWMNARLFYVYLLNLYKSQQMDEAGMD